MIVSARRLLSSIPQSICKVLFWLAERGNLSQSELRALSGLSERAIRYALEFLKKENLIVEVVNLSDIRNKKYEVCASVAQLEEQRTCNRQELKLVSDEIFAGCGCDSHPRLSENRKEVIK